MATLPSYVIVQFPEWGEGFDPSVERTEMERGPAKQVIRNSRVMKQVRAGFLFKTAADSEAFEVWYFDVIGRIGWFDVVHPRTRATISARFVGGDIGELVPVGPGFSLTRRTVTLEFTDLLLVDGPGVDLLVFENAFQKVGGDIFDREFRAYDAETGDIVWRFKANSSVLGVPMSYEIDGVQYIAVMAGYGGAAANYIPRAAEAFGIPFTPVRGGTLWVFALDQ